MGFWSPRKTQRLVGALTLGLLGLFASGCGDDSKPSGVSAGPGHGHIEASDICATPNQGCECAEIARVVECGSVQRQAGGQVWCSVGHRTCSSDGTWGACEVEGLHVLPAPGAGQNTQALGTTKACIDNPCDPFCQQIVDSGSDLDLPDGFQETDAGGITLIPKEGSLNDTTCTGITVTPSPQTLTVTSFGSATPGLLGEYYNERFGEGEVPAASVPTATRLDPQVNFDWESGPIAGVGFDNFTVRWSGWLKPTTTGVYQLCTVSDDGVRLWLDDVRLINHWDDHSAVEDCSAAPGVTLTAGSLYQLRIELFEAAGEASAKLRWIHSGAPSGELVPSTVLLPPGAENQQQQSFTVDPPSAEFTALGTPAGCFDGPLRAVWAVDRLDRASVSNQGAVSLLSPIAGDIKTTAYVGAFSGTGTVHVVVDVLDSALAPAGSVVKFQGATSGTDPMKVLYPYVDTVFPLALRAPTIQWDNGGTAADAVMVTLRYPATGTTSFQWSKVLPDSDPGRYTVPQDIWAKFEASAKGQPAAYVVQRITGGVARPPVTRRIVFAAAPVRGKIYYTQYARDNTTNMMVADPGSPTSASSVFPSDAGGSNGRRCPVCHSVSANGTMFATADKSFSANGGLSKVNADGTFTLLSDYTATTDPYRVGSQDWRGFAWSPLTPDGKYALAANNIWGNTRQSVVGIDPATRTVALPGGFVSGGNGTGLLARYYMNTGFTGWDWRRTDPKIDFSWAAASPGGPVPTTFSAAWTGQIQAYTTETYTFELQATGGVRLVVGGNVLIDELANTASRTFIASAALTKGVKTPILLQFADTAADAAVFLRWRSPTVPLALVPQTQLYPNDGWHGVTVTYYDNDDFTNPFIADRIESNIDATWGAGGPRPMPSSDNDSWSAVYTGRLQAPATGNLRLCVTSDDDVVVSLGGITLITQGGVVDACSGDFVVTQGTKYDLEVRYREFEADAYLNLSWQMAGVFGPEIVPSERLSPPAAWTVPTHGLTATYYDTDNFNSTLATGSAVSAATRIEQNADLTWNDQRPEFSSAITSSDYFTARFTGGLETPCAGLYEFEVSGNNGGRLWIDDLRQVPLWSNGTQQAAVWLEAGMHDLKLDHREDAGTANVNVRWKAACMNVDTFTPIPNANLYPTGDDGTGGYVLNGGDNGNGSSYFVWQTPTTAGSASVDVTAAGAGRWGLGATTMMVPSFAPDASKLVFIDGDSAAGNGWRKGLSVFSFDQAGQIFKNRKTVVSTWPNGDVLKWPVFESDSRSVIYQATVPADMCCRKTDWTKYGYMGPTNYFEDPGRLFSVDTQAATPTPVELTKLNQGERALDRNKSYQATMLPQATAGYRWAVFTSTRPYGNTLNLEGQQDFSNTAAYTHISEYGKLQSMLWVSAVDDATSGNADRSHPAFFLPNQNFSDNPASGYLNERAYWVTEACRPAGTGAGSSCDVDEDCCGGNGASPTALCRIDAPVSSPPTRHCFKLPEAGMCVMPGSACVSSDECCTGSVCDDGTCVKPPPLAKYAPANFERIYASNCGAGTKVDWTFFDYKASVPEVGGALEFYAESSDDMADFHTVPVYPSAGATPEVALIRKQGPPGDLTTYARITLDAPLTAAGVVERKYLKITIRFIPNQTGVAAPLLTDWRQSFSCPPGE